MADAKTIDISKKLGFHTKQDKCKGCRGENLPLLREVSLCKTCILLGMVPIRLDEMGHPRIIVPHNYRIGKNADTDCPICLEALGDEIAQCSQCNGQFHPVCYIAAGNKTCPLCRCEISLK